MFARAAYLREAPEVIDKAKEILLGPDIIIYHSSGAPQQRIKNVRMVQSVEGIEGGVAYSDGSRYLGHIAAATITRYEYLGRLATVMGCRPTGESDGFGDRGAGGSG